MKNAVCERLWVFDFDGTLARLVPDRDRAQMHPACVGMLRKLVAMPRQHVAILSSRLLDDLIPRVPVPGVFLGGGSGTEWHVPDGGRLTLEGEKEDELHRLRTSILPEIRELASLPGVDMEDKRWSVALHTRKATRQDKEKLYARFIAWHSPDKGRIFAGPEVLDIQFLPEVDKAFGLRTLCRILQFDPSGGRVVYAGDDENDAVAMRWVVYLEGTAFMIGTSFPVAGARIVGDQRVLAREIEKLARFGKVPSAATPTRHNGQLR